MTHYLFTLKQNKLNNYQLVITHDLFTLKQNKLNNYQLVIIHDLFTLKQNKLSNYQLVIKNKHSIKQKFMIVLEFSDFKASGECLV